MRRNFLSLVFSSLFLLILGFCVLLTVYMWLYRADLHKPWINLEDCEVDDVFYYSDEPTKAQSGTEMETEFKCGKDQHYYVFLVKTKMLFEREGGKLKGVNRNTIFYARHSSDNICHFKSKKEAEKDARSLQAGGKLKTCKYSPILNVERRDAKLDISPMFHATNAGYSRDTKSSATRHAILSLVVTVMASLLCIYSIYRYCSRPALLSSSSYPYSPSGVPNVHSSRPNSRTPLSLSDARLLIRSFSNADEDGAICAVCLEEMQNDSNTVLLPCDHAYHEDCVMQWFRKGSASCPYCNQDFTELVEELRSNGARSTPAASRSNQRLEREGANRRENADSQGVV